MSGERHLWSVFETLVLNRDLGGRGGARRADSQDHQRAQFLQRRKPTSNLFRPLTKLCCTCNILHIFSITKEGNSYNDTNLLGIQFTLAYVYPVFCKLNLEYRNQPLYFSCYTLHFYSVIGIDEWSCIFQNILCFILKSKTTLEGLSYKTLQDIYVMKK